MHHGSQASACHHSGRRNRFVEEVLVSFGKFFWGCFGEFGENRTVYHVWAVLAEYCFPMLYILGITLVLPWFVHASYLSHYEPTSLINRPTLNAVSQLIEIRAAQAQICTLDTPLHSELSLSKSLFMPAGVHCLQETWEPVLDSTEKPDSIASLGVW